MKLIVFLFFVICFILVTLLVKNQINLYQKGEKKDSSDNFELDRTFEDWIR